MPCLDFSKLRLTQPSLAGSGADLGNMQQNHNSNFSMLEFFLLILAYMQITIASVCLCDTLFVFRYISILIKQNSNYTISTAEQNIPI